MCGIIGYVSLNDKAMNSEKEDFLREALILDTFRGRDSTGLLTVCDDFTISHHKEVLMGWDFVTTQEYLEMPNGWAAIGHNRAATRGEVNIDNAHPFISGPVTMVHNGTLDNMGRNLPAFNKKVAVDSINIANALAHIGPEEATEVLKNIRGAYALAWTDERDQSINIARNDRRPLHFTHNYSKSILWFMSDGNHLDMLKKSRWCGGTDMGNIYAFKKHQHFKWKKGKLMPEVVDYVPFVQVIHRTPYRKPAGNTKTRTDARALSSTEFERQTSKSIKPQAPYSRRIYLNGETHPIPEPLIQELDLCTELTPDDLLVFKPEGWYSYPKHKNRNDTDKGYGYALGTVWVPAWEVEWPTVVHHIRERHADKVTLSDWAVTPYAMTADGPRDSGACIMAKLNRFNIPEGLIDPVEQEEDSEVNALLGPFGRLYSLLDWSNYTRHGCSNCSKDLMTNEHDTIMWVGDMESTPICKACADYLSCSSSGIYRGMLQ